MRRKLNEFILVLICLLLPACGKVEPVTDSGFYFDTYVKFVLYGDDRKYLKDCLDICAEAELIYSAHDEGSLLYGLNHGEIHDYAPLLPALDSALEYEKLTDGAVDPAIGSLTGLWDFSSPDDKKEPPADSDINEALKHIDSSKIIIEDNTVRLAAPGTQIDLGFIAKGCISKEIRDHLIECGVKSGIINLGGNIVVIGSRPDGRAYNVGILKPFYNETMVTFDICDAAIVTSGVYERYFGYDDKLYHHILDPRTGYPADNELLSVTIVCYDPVKADALSTACLVMGLDKGLDLIENTPDTEALFIDNEMNIHTTSGFPEYR